MTAPTTAPPVVRAVLRTPGEPFENATRKDMETRFGCDFSRIRIHRDSQAIASARAINALAYTAGQHIVIGNQETLDHPGRLLAHELAHTIQQRTAEQKDSSLAISTSQHHEVQADNLADGALARRGVSHPITEHSRGVQLQADAAAPPREDYVFIMGKDAPKTRNQFYTSASRYFRGHFPQATMIDSERTLDGVLSWIQANVKDPIGNLYVVAHANEDGTLGVGLNDADLPVRHRKAQGFTGDGRLSVAELRDALHPAGAGASQLTALGKQIDKQTTVHIRGCSIGQNGEMLNLLDEAFGGAGRVIAPTHEQRFGFDPTLSGRAAEKFRSDQAKSIPEPQAIDPTLRGRAKAQAQRERLAAVRQRKRDVQALLKSSRPTEKRLAEVAGTTESLSGPNIERPGTKRFSATEIRAEVEARYDHLTKPARQRLAQEWFKAQHIEDKVFTVFNGSVPATSAQVRSTYAREFRKQHFRPDPKAPVEITETEQGDKITFNFEVSGVGREGDSATLRIGISDIPTDDGAIELAKRDFPNPDDYDWRVVHKRSGARMSLIVHAERVRAYLHHRSLDASAHEPFDPSESDPRFYGESTFAPP